MTTKVDHNYPSAGALTIVDADTSEPIPYALIKIFEADKYPPPTTSQEKWVAQTETDVNGEWLDPIFLADGVDWVVQISKRLTYKTTAVEIST